MNIKLKQAVVVIFTLSTLFSQQLESITGSNGSTVGGFYRGDLDGSYGAIILGDIDDITITHSFTQNISRSVRCGNAFGHADNSYMRAFDLRSFGIVSDFGVTSIDIGIFGATSASGSQPVDVNLYTWNDSDPFTFANFNLVGSTSVSVSDQSFSILKIPVTATIPANSVLVVEFFIPDGRPANSLYVGMNTDGQDDLTYLAASPCGTVDPIDLVLIGFPYHLVMNVNGTFLKSAAISGYVIDAMGVGIADAKVTFSNGGATVKTNSAGFYITSVSAGWGGTSTASKAPYQFTPKKYTYENLIDGVTDQNFVDVNFPTYSVHIWGLVRDLEENGVEKVAVEFNNGGATVMTDSIGYYETSVSSGWSGTAVPQKDDLVFRPAYHEFFFITEEQPNRNFVGTADHRLITGHVMDTDGNGISGVDVVFSNGGATITTGSSGFFETSVTFDWNGTASPSKQDMIFTPSEYTYVNLIGDQYDQDFSGASGSSNSKLGILEEELGPGTFRVAPAYPNPFNPSTTIEYSIPENSWTSNSNIQVNIYDITGKHITTLVNSVQSAGIHSIQWNGTNEFNKSVPGGMYFGQISYNNEVKTVKLVLLK